MGWQGDMGELGITAPGLRWSWVSKRTGLTWLVFQEGEKGHWFATYDGQPLRIQTMMRSKTAAAGSSFASGGRRTWWRTVENARRGCEEYDELYAEEKAKRDASDPVTP